MSQSLFKKLNPSLKNHIRNLGNFRQAVEGPKNWYLMGYFCPKNILLQLKHYIPRIYPTLLSTTCEDSPNDVYHFWKHFSFFTSQPLHVFSAQTLHTFHKSSQGIKVKILRLATACIIKFTQFLMSFLEPRVSFFSNFASLFSVMRLTLLYFFI